MIALQQTMWASVWQIANALPDAHYFYLGGVGVRAAYSDPMQTDNFVRRKCRRSLGSWSGIALLLGGIFAPRRASRIAGPIRPAFVGGPLEADVEDSEEPLTW